MTTTELINESLVKEFMSLNSLELFMSKFSHHRLSVCLHPLDALPASAVVDEGLMLHIHKAFQESMVVVSNIL